MKVFIVEHHDKNYETSFVDKVFESETRANGYLAEVESKLGKKSRKTQTYIVTESEIEFDKNGIFKSYFEDLEYRHKMQQI